MLPFRERARRFRSWSSERQCCCILFNFQVWQLSIRYFYIKCGLPGVPPRRLKKKLLFVPRLRSWENAGVGMVDVKVTILYIHGAGHVQGGWLYAVGRKNCDMGRTPYRASLAASSGAFDFASPAQHAVSARNRWLIKVSQTRQRTQIFQREVFKMQTLHVGRGGSAAAWSDSLGRTLVPQKCCFPKGGQAKIVCFFRKKASIKTGLEVKLHDKLNVFTYGYISINIYIYISLCTVFSFNIYLYIFTKTNAYRNHCVYRRWMHESNRSGRTGGEGSSSRTGIRWGAGLFSNQSKDRMRDGQVLMGHGIRSTYIYIL